MKVKLFLIGFIILIMLSSCNLDPSNDIPKDLDFKEEMRNFVIDISKSTKLTHPNFIIIPQNGIELITENGDVDDDLHWDYLNSIDAHGQEDLHFGYDEDNVPTPSIETAYLVSFLDQSKDNGKKILVTDYCSSTSKVNDSYSLNNSLGYISFAAHKRELNEIPSFPSTIYHENNNDIVSLEDSENFLYLINPDQFSSKSNFITAIQATNYDLLIMDLFFSENITFSSSEINELRLKANGGKRLVICYMSIGEAEDYRYYWEESWNNNPPSWIYEENSNWPGNYKVKYWEKSWQDIIFGTPESFVQMILESGFDGVYLDIIDAFEAFE